MTTYVEEWLERYPSIKKFEKLLKRRRIAPRTMEGYVVSVKEFCDLINYDDPETALDAIKKIEDKEEWLDGLIGEMSSKVGDNRVLSIMKGVKGGLTSTRLTLNGEILFCLQKRSWWKIERQQKKN